MIRPSLFFILCILAAAWILSRDTLSKIPQYFSEAPFMRDSQGTPAPESQREAAKDTAAQLNKIQFYAFQRWGANAKISINSGFRSVAYNTQIGGARNSYHTKSQAVDFKVDGVPAREVQKFLLQLIREGKIKAGGLGLANTYTHYDTRGTLSAWTYSNGNTGTTTGVDPNTYLQ